MKETPMVPPLSVPTVRGPVAAGDLGSVLMHEHVFVLTEELRRSLPESWDEQQQIDDAVARLTALAPVGVSTIVDPTVIGLGRDVRRVAAVNERVDLNIVVATGIYTLTDVPYYFRYHGPGTLLGGPERMTELFVREITEGIAGTGIKAAFLKCAIEDELTPGVEHTIAPGPISPDDGPCSTHAVPGSGTSNSQVPRGSARIWRGSRRTSSSPPVQSARA